MENYYGYENWLKENGYTSWKVYISYIKTINATLKVDGFEKIVSVPHLQQLFSQLETDSGFSSRGESDRSNLLSGFRNYINYITESQMPMRVWRIGSNWGGIDILPIFNEHQITYAGKEVETQIQKVKKGDIVAVTKGKAIVAVGKVAGVVDLKSFDATYAHKYEDVKAITMSPFYFKEDFPEVDFGMYDGQGKQFHEAHGYYAESITNLFNRLSIDNMDKKIIELIKYKKQIILQGPPGTGKTRKAKEIAREFINLTDDILNLLITKGLKFKTVKGQTSYTVEHVSARKVTLLRENTNPNTISFDAIINSYNQKEWFNYIDNNDNRMAVATAKYIYDNILELSGQFKLIQFHPSYTYEDFVRGIVAESRGDKIEYKNVNKILGQFAADAKQNSDNSKKDITNISKENKTKEYFEEFVDELSEKIIAGERIILTPSVNLIDVDEDAFRYKGNDGWSALGNRMLFKDIIRAFLDGNKLRQDIKKNKNLSGLAIQHASYFVRVLNMFQDYLSSHDLKFDNLSDNIVELRKYVLIIDEINRANLSSVLGELIYALEYRGENVESMYAVDGNNELVLPPNLYIIGTMNTADRSVGHIDYAIRRRFAFVDVQPKDLTPELADKFHKDLFEKVAMLFSTNLSPEFEKKDVQLGHSYFIDKSEEGGSMDIRLQYEIKPILREYLKDGILIGENISQSIEELTA